MASDNQVLKPRSPLARHYDVQTRFEIGVDEAGRGPMFGPLYVAAVILPKESDDSQGFHYDWMKDSKKFTSKKKIAEVAEHIKTHAVAWHVAAISAAEIDRINIRQAVFRGMHECIREVIRKTSEITETPRLADYMGLIDGNDFAPYFVYDEAADTMEYMRHETFEGGDNRFCAIAAASILAKCDRDAHMLDLCRQFPILETRYKINTNMGYGTKPHMEAILEHGIVEGHRRTYGICKQFAEVGPLV